MSQQEAPLPSTNPTAISRAIAATAAGTTTPSRVRGKQHYITNRSRLEDDNCNGGPAKGKAKSSSTDLSSDPAKNRGSMGLKKAKSVEEETAAAVAGSQKARPVNRPVVEQFARPRRPVSRKSDESAATTDEKRKKVEELEEKLVANEVLINDLQAQVSSLKADLDEARSSNAELELKNEKLSQDLATAEAKITTLTSHDKPVGEHPNPKFKDIQKLIASKLEQPKVSREVALKRTPVKTRSPSPSPSLSPSSSPSPSPSPPPIPKFLVPQVPARKDPMSSPLAPVRPPPPPPPPPRAPARAGPTHKAPPIVQFFKLLEKQDSKKDTRVSLNQSKPAVSSVHSSIVGEIQNRSAHLLAIKTDIATKGEFINGLIQKVLTASYTDIEGVLQFVDWLDGELALLADEQAVLKHFKWPERKADAMREAAVEYRDLKKLENELSSHGDDLSVQCRVALDKMASLLDKSERSIKRLVRLRASAMRSYQDFKIPVDWMLDSGMVAKIKQASMKLAKSYMKRVTVEFELVRNLDRETTREALLLQGVRFAYRTHQFAGGLDSETLCAFEEIRQRVRLSQESFLAGITSS